MLKKAASFVLASLNASTYRKGTLRSLARRGRAERHFLNILEGPPTLFSGRSLFSYDGLKFQSHRPRYLRDLTHHFVNVSVSWWGGWIGQRGAGLDVTLSHVGVLAPSWILADRQKAA